MTQDNKSIRRRKYLKSIGVAGTIAVAGCTGSGGSGSSDGDSGGSGDDSGGSGSDSGGDSGGSGGDSGGSANWPPSSGSVDMQTPANPGDKRDTVPRTWMDVAQQYYPGDVRTTTTSRTGAQGLSNLNSLFNGPPDGSKLGSSRALSSCILQIARPEAEFNIPEFKWVVQFLSDTRGLQLNHNSLPIEEHFQWSWDEFVDYVEDNGIRSGTATPAQRLYANLIREWEPRFNEDNYQIINMPGGSETRAAMLREDLDLYYGGYNSNVSTRTKYYKTQFAMVNPDKYPNLLEKLRAIEPEDAPGVTLPDSAIITNTSFPSDKGEQLVDIVLDAVVAAAPPGTPQDIVDIHLDAFQKTGEDPETAERVAESFSDYSFNPAYGDTVEEFVNNKFEILNDQVADLIKEIFS